MANIEQADLWNRTVADAWIRHADDFDVTLDPLGRAVMERLDLSSGQRVLDIGCGVGATTRELATRVAPGQVIGADISARMVAEASRRAVREGLENIDFVELDVQTGDLGVEKFDVVFSRVGVMFFEDPTVAFTNIASFMSPDARLGFICFQAPMANPFIVVPTLSAAPHLEMPPPPPPGAPGPFSLAEPDDIRAILGAAGFVDVTIDAGPDEVTIPGADDLEAMARRLLEQNPGTAMRIARLPPEQVAVATAAVAEALRPYRDGDELRMGAGTWVVTAGAPRA